MLRFKRSQAFNSLERFVVHQRRLFTFRFRSGVRTTENELLALSGNIDFVEGKKMGSLLYDYIIVNNEDKIKKEAREEGRKEERVLVASNLINLGTPFDVIAKATGLSLAQIQTLADV